MNTARTYISEDEEQKNCDDALVSVPKDDRTPGADNVTQNVLDMRVSCGSSNVHRAAGSTIMQLMVSKVAKMIAVSIKDHIPPRGSRTERACWNPYVISNTSAMRLKTNIKVVIPNMNILDRDDNRPGLPLGKSVRPTLSTKVWLNLTEGCRQRRHRM
jgi:hypothetical protein